MEPCREPTFPDERGKSDGRTGQGDRSKPRDIVACKPRKECLKKDGMEKKYGTTKRSSLITVGKFWSDLATSLESKF